MENTLVEMHCQHKQVFLLRERYKIRSPRRYCNKKQCIKNAKKYIKILATLPNQACWLELSNIKRFRTKFQGILLRQSLKELRRKVILANGDLRIYKKRRRIRRLH